MDAGAQVQIIGVIADIRQIALDEPARETIYENNMFNGRVKVALVARTAGEPLAIARKLREAIWSIDKQQPIASIETFDDVVSHSMARPRLLTVLLGVPRRARTYPRRARDLRSARIPLVNERQREIGVRIALGALRVICAVDVRRPRSGAYCNGPRDRLGGALDAYPPHVRRALRSESDRSADIRRESERFCSRSQRSRAGFPPPRGPCRPGGGLAIRNEVGTLFVPTDSK